MLYDFTLTLFRPSSAGLMTAGQLVTMYRLAKPDEHDRFIDLPPTFSQTKFILVSGPIAQVPLENRRLPSHMVLSDGRTLLLLRNVPARVIDTQQHTDEHSRLYAHLFLYVPWVDEEEFLGDARRSLEFCRAKWEEWGDAAIDLKSQLHDFVKQSWLS